LEVSGSEGCLTDPIWQMMEYMAIHRWKFFGWNVENGDDGALALFEQDLLDIN
jgi:hypothetical protein